MFKIFKYFLNKFKKSEQFKEKYLQESFYGATIPISFSEFLKCQEN